MVGKAIYILLKEKISELSAGGVFPVVMPQNAKYSLSENNSFPAIVYDCQNELIKSKDPNPNKIKSTLSLDIISKNYKEVDELSKKVKNLIDNYIDFSEKGLIINGAYVPSYIDNFGTKHNFIKDIDVSTVFYKKEDDDYYDELYLYSRTIVYDIYYSNTVTRFSNFSPLFLNYCFSLTNSTKATSAVFNEETMALSVLPYPRNSYNSGGVYNKTSGFSWKPTTSDSNENYKSYLTPFGTVPFYNNDNRNRCSMSGVAALIPIHDLISYINLAHGALIVFVYKPVDPNSTGRNNYLLGDISNISLIEGMHLSHKKVGSDITVQFNPRGNFTDYSSDNITLISSTSSANYWDADYHFLALSVGGDKAQTGGSYNQSGWFEYFNSDFNPHLTTGQILKDNSFSGNSNTYSENLTFACIGGHGKDLLGSAQLNLYETIIIAPDLASTHGINADSAYVQPTDIIYKKIKDYIYNKFKSLK